MWTCYFCVLFSLLMWKGKCYKWFGPNYSIVRFFKSVTTLMKLALSYRFWLFSPTKFIFCVLSWSGDEVVKRLSGPEVTPEYFNENGFDAPILVEKKDGLGLRVPPPDISIEEIERRVGKFWCVCVCKCVQTFKKWKNPKNR